MSSYWTISKEFRVSYAHRVFTQDLFDSGFVPKCRNIHGHDSIIELSVTTTHLTNNMVIDYTLLKKEMFEKYHCIHPIDLDHKLLISLDDPNFDKYKVIYPQLKDATADWSTYVDSEIFVVDFVPTAETLAKFFYKHFKIFMENMKRDYGIDYIDLMTSFNETEGSKCVYWED